MTTYATITYRCGHTFDLPTNWPDRKTAARYIREEQRRAKRLPCHTCIERGGVPCERCGEYTKSIYAGGEPGGPMQRVCRPCLIAQGWTPADVA